MANTKLPQLEEFPTWWMVWFWEEHYQWNFDNGCLEWKTSVRIAKYARVSFNNVIYHAHRLAYYFYYEKDPGDLLVRHLCNNPRCANPRHLTLGTHWENSQDMVRSGRSMKGREHWSKKYPERLAELKAAGAYAQATKRLKEMNGQNHPCTVLTPENVREIRQRREACNGNRYLIGKMNRELAEKFGVTHSNISAVALGKSHQEVE